MAASLPPLPGLGRLSPSPPTQYVPKAAEMWFLKEKRVQTGGEANQQVTPAAALARGSAGCGCGHRNAISHLSSAFLTVCTEWAPLRVYFWKGIKANGSCITRGSFTHFLIFSKSVKKGNQQQPREGSPAPGTVPRCLP